MTTLFLLILAASAAILCLGSLRAIARIERERREGRTRPGDRLIAFAMLAFGAVVLALVVLAL